nr:MAG: myristylated membrane protein-like protein [Diabrotica toursvirus 3a]
MNTDDIIEYDSNKNIIQFELLPNHVISLISWHIIEIPGIPAYDIWFKSKDVGIVLARVFSPVSETISSHDKYIITKHIGLDYTLFVCPIVTEKLARKPFYDVNIPPMVFTLKIKVEQKPSNACELITVENCPINPITNKPMSECMLWRRTDDIGEECRKHLRKSHKDKSIYTFCNAVLGNHREDCRCILPDENDPEYKKNLKEIKGNPNCWYFPCLTNSYLTPSVKPICEKRVCKVLYKIEGNKVIMENLNLQCDQEKRKPEENYTVPIILGFILLNFFLKSFYICKNTI